MLPFAFISTANGKAISCSQYIGNLNGEVESEEEIAQKKKYLLVKQRFEVGKSRR